MAAPDGSMLSDEVGDFLRNRFLHARANTHENRWGPHKLLVALLVNLLRTVKPMCNMHQSDEAHAYANDV